MAAVAGAIALAAIGYAGLASGPAGPPIPRDGRWRGDPPGDTPWETRLERLPDGRYEYQNLDASTGHGTAGILALSRLADGTELLSGKLADIHNCPSCTNVGFLEFIVLDEDHLYQNRAMFGPSHDNYNNAYPPYRYKWEGPVGARAEAP
jgi:hypothetical protein